MMVSGDIATILSQYGLAVLAPLAIIEGPIVTVIGGWLAGQHILSLPAVFIVVLLGDVIGDVLFYWLGHNFLGRMSAKWRNRLGLSPVRMESLVYAFEQKGSSILVAGKWTHAAGFAVLVAAGAARMPLWRFVVVNALASIPKSLLFLALGYAFGGAHAMIAEWISTGGTLLFGALLFGLFIWHRWVRKKPK